MKKIILCLTITAGIAVGYVSAKDAPADDEQTYVYICTGPSSKVYHTSPKCNGLRNCSKDIKKVTLEQAQQMGRRACKICVK